MLRELFEFLIEGVGWRHIGGRPGREAGATSAQEQGPISPRALKIIVSDNLINTNFSNN
jgi:hypothetical protein